MIPEQLISAKEDLMLEAEHLLEYIFHDIPELEYSMSCDFYEKICNMQPEKC